MPRAKKGIGEETPIVSSESTPVAEPKKRTRAKKIVEDSPSLPTAEKEKPHPVKAERTHSGVFQAEINIGTAGHVDHGKCIALDEPILLNNDFSDGTILLEKTISSVEPQIISESERLFDIPNFRVFSLDPRFDLVSVPAKLFTQNYSGPMIQVITKDGKRIKASPEHPLLVHTGKEIQWKKACELQVGQFIGALKKLPESPVFKDPYPNWKEELAKACWIVTREEAMQLSEKTTSFTFFEKLTSKEWNAIRILARKSIAQLEKSCKISPGYLASKLKMDFLPNSIIQKLIPFFQSHKIQIPDNVIINIKSKSKGFLEIRNFGTNDDAIRFLALIVSESHIGEKGIKFAQEENVLLDQFLAICKENFCFTPIRRGNFDYCLENKSIIEFLKARYGIVPGNSWKSGIPTWIFSLPNEKLAIFLRTFFSAEGNVDSKSNQIALVQANKQSIQLIGYALKKFGVLHSIHPTTKYATNTVAKTRRVYWQIIISGRSNLKQYQKSIGFDLPYKQTALEKMCSKKGIGKTTDRTIPTDHILLSELIGALGLKKRTFSKRTTSLKEQPWFFAYQDSRSKNAISEEKLTIVLDFMKERILEMIDDLHLVPTNDLLSKWAVSHEKLGLMIGKSRKVIFTYFNSKKNQTKQKYASVIKRAFNTILQTRLEKAEILFNQLQANAPSTIEWCKIKSLEEVPYHGPIIDLQVPGYHNFAAGTGALISHNTSITKALSGKWTDTHSEELKRGISIRLGYADATFYEYPGKEGAEKYGVLPEKDGVKGKILRKVSFIDAPGHETLMTTMLSGATLLNGALLVIAANELCPQPRTAEHLMALQIAGIQNLLVVQNKVDLVDKKRALESYAEIKKFLAEHGYANAPIVPVSANFNANVDLLIELIQSHIPTPHHDTSKPLKMYISRSFDVNKPGTAIEKIKGGVLGGSIIQGTLSPGQKVEVTPGLDGVPFLIETQSINISEGSLSNAHPGGLIAVGTKLDPGITSMDKLKGQILCEPNTLPKPTDHFWLEWHELPRLLGEKLPFPHMKELMVFTLGTNTMVGEVAGVKKTQLDVQLKGKMTLEKGQKVAISRRDKAAWRLSGWGVIQ